MPPPEAVQHNGLDEDVNGGLDGHSPCYINRGTGADYTYVISKSPQ